MILVIAIMIIANIETHANGTCKYKAQIRQTGDFKDHIKFFKGKIFQSLKVKLLNGNVLGNIRFKLLIPQARGEDEVIVTNILKSMDILSPEIFQIKTNINGLKNPPILFEW